MNSNLTSCITYSKCLATCLNTLQEHILEDWKPQQHMTAKQKTLSCTAPHAQHANGGQETVEFDVFAKSYLISSAMCFFFVIVCSMFVHFEWWVYVQKLI